MLLGRKTYEISRRTGRRRSRQPVHRSDEQHAKYVASRNLTPSSGRLDAAGGRHRRCRTQAEASDGGNINVVGSGDLAKTLMRQSLADEYRLAIHPVTVGTGERLFADGAISTAREPVSVSTTKGGTVVGDPAERWAQLRQLLASRFQCDAKSLSSSGGYNERT